MGITIFIHPRKHDTLLIQKTRAKLHLKASWTLNLLLNIVITAHQSGKLAETYTNWVYLHSLQQALSSMRKTNRIPRNVSRMTVFHCQTYVPQIIPTLRFPSLWTAYFQLRVFKLPQRTSSLLYSSGMRNLVTGWSMPYLSRQPTGFIFNA